MAAAFVLHKAFIKRALEILYIPSEFQIHVYKLHYHQKMSHDNQVLAVLFANAASNPPLESDLHMHLYHDSVLLSRHCERKEMHYIIEVVSLKRDGVQDTAREHKIVATCACTIIASHVAGKRDHL